MDASPAAPARTGTRGLGSRRAEDPDAAVAIFLPATAQTRALQTDVQQTRWYLPTWHPARSDISRLNAAENDRASELP